MENNKSFITAIIGDIAGSKYEWNNAKKREDIRFFKEGSRLTDDSVLTLAVADWLVCSNGSDALNEKEKNEKSLAKYLKKYATRYPYARYGRMFRKWAFDKYDFQPFNSFGNGSGMRCSPVAYVAKTKEEVLELAKMSAEVTHNHEEGIKGAQAIALSIFMALNGSTKSEIKKEVEDRFGYNLDRKVNDIHWSHAFDATCQVTVPEAIIAFLESTDYESALENAIYIGGDSDTIACMAGAIAGAFYDDIPEDYINYAKPKMDKQQLLVLENFEKKFL